MSRKLEDTRLAGSTASRPKQRTSPGWSARLGGLAGLAPSWRVGGPGRRAWRAGSAGTAGRVGRHGGPGGRARRARSGARRAGSGARRAGSGGTAGRVGGALAGRVGGHGKPDGAGRAGRSWPGGAGGAGRVVREELAWWVRIGLRTHEWFLEMCVPSDSQVRSWHVG